MKIQALIFVLFSFFARAYAQQLPDCNGDGRGLIYYEYAGGIFSVDPTDPQSVANPTFRLPTISFQTYSIVVSENINSTGGPSPTYYLMHSDGNYYYYDGSGWVNTGHKAIAPNLGAGGGYIYSFDGSGGQVFRYDGTSDAKLAFTVFDYKAGGPYDIAADCRGNVYVLRTKVSATTGKYLRKYSPNGTLLQAWSVTGFSSVQAGAGLAIVNNKVYFDDSSYTEYWEGTIKGNDVHFVKVANKLFYHRKPGDLSNCPFALSTPVHVTANTDTLFACDSVTRHRLFVQGKSQGAVVSWKVLNGNATIFGNGDTIEVTTSSDAKILLSATDTAACGNIATDTVEVISVQGGADALDEEFFDLCADLIDTLPGVIPMFDFDVIYTFTWQPAQYIISGDSSNAAVIKRDTSRTYILTVSTPAAYGDCTWTDSVTVPAAHKINGDITITGGAYCIDDSLLFSSNGTQVLPQGTPLQYLWLFGDGGTATKQNVQYAYTTSGTYTAALILTDSAGCTDTVSYKLPEIPASPSAFLGADTAICKGSKLNLPVSISGDIDSYAWSDGYPDSTRVVAEAGNYIFTVSNRCGAFTDTINITNKDCSIWFPGAFSPNGDGKNDFAHLVGYDPGRVSDFELLIFNRWGERVFATTDATKGWDGNYNGKQASVGTYYYLLKYTVQGEEPQMLKGDITLVR